MSKGRYTAKRIREQAMTYHKQKRELKEVPLMKSNEKKNSDNNKRKRPYSPKLMAVLRRWKRASTRVIKEKEKNQKLKRENNKLIRSLKWFRKKEKLLSTQNAKLAKRLQSDKNKKRKFQIQKADMKRQNKKIKTEIQHMQDHIDGLLEKQ